MENNGVEKVKFKKSKIYAVIGLSIDQDTKSNVSLPNVEGKKAHSDILRTFVEEKNKFKLDLKILKENYFDINVPFQKRINVLINGFQYYDTTTKKQETIGILRLLPPPKKFWFYVGTCASRAYV